MNGKDVIKRLEKLVKINGSHYMMQNIELNRKVPIPVHGSRDIKIGTIKAIEKQTGVKLL